ncbi:MAG: hypothetical protein ACHQUC_07695 [Chlamydiales bacterium]
MKVRLVQIDGKLPNLALMNLASFFKSNGDFVELTRHVDRDLFATPDKVFASSIFTFSEKHLNTFKTNWPEAIIGGTGSGNWGTVEDIIGQHKGLDYSIYDYPFSIGFTQRGCRLKCGFCVVPKKEGSPKTVASIYDIWRGEGHPKKICLLDNDFFGQPKEEWRQRIKEIREGGFKVCFNQGLNVRLLDEESCAALASIQYRDDQFQRRRLYTAWDNLRDEQIFFRGVDMLEKAGIPPKHLMVYMLIGYDPEETWERIFHRFNKMVERNILPYPMVYNNERKDLKRFQRWVVTGLYRFVKWENYRP